MDDDAGKLNQILWVTWSPSTYNPIVAPVQQGPYENDHFIEVQHFTTILIKILKTRNEYNNWYQQPIGFFIDLATFVNEHRNIFQIGKAMNQAKKSIRLEDYHSNAGIQQYLGFHVSDGHGGQITVKQSVHTMLQAMADRRTEYGKYTIAVGQEVLKVLKW